MTEPRSGRQSVPPRVERILAIVRSLAEHSERVILTTHAQERMLERGIFDVDVFRALRAGRVSGPVKPARNPDEWKCKIVNKIKGSREVGVVTIVVKAERLIILTVEWEDLR